MRIDVEFCLITLVVCLFLFGFLILVKENSTQAQNNRIVELCLTKADTVEKITACKDLFKK